MHEHEFIKRASLTEARSQDPLEGFTIPLETERAAGILGHIWESPSTHQHGRVENIKDSWREW